MRRLIAAGGLIATIFVPSSGLAFKLNNGDAFLAPLGLCDDDPEACPSATPHKQEFPRELDQVAPICDIDPCACSKCDMFHIEKAPKSGFESFDSGPTMRTGTLQVRVPTRNAGPPVYPGVFLDQNSFRTGQLGRPTFNMDRATAAVEHGGYKLHSRSCNNSHQRPPEFWRELLLNKENISACNTAAEKMVDQRTHYYTIYSQILTGQVAPHDALTAFSVFDEYSKECIHKLNDAGANVLLSRIMGGAFFEKAKQNVGELHFPGQQFHCTASFVRRDSNQSADLGIMTAAHCVGDPVKGSSDSRLQYASIIPNMEFTTLEGITYEVTVDPDLRGFEYDSNEDLVVLWSTTPFQSGDPGGFQLSLSPKIWDPLYIVGINPFLASLGKASSGVTPALADVASVSLEPGCRIYGMDGPTILHNCQTEKGMSGSPIFEVRDGTAVIVGVHSGDAENRYITGCEKDSAAAVNFGTLIPQ
jgi:hypothetical protein